MKKGLCPCCLEIKPLTAHHIIPKRFNRHSNNTPILYLCSDCHQQLEQRLYKITRFVRERFIREAKQFVLERRRQ